MQNKAEIRADLIKKRCDLPRIHKESSDNDINKILLNDEDFLNSKCIFTYYSTETEISTIKIIEKAFELSKKVCIPKCFGNGIMKAYFIDPFTKLEKSKFGIFEPCETLHEAIDIDVCIVPALATDTFGYRLGYGGGYYDRFMKNKNFKKICLCRKQNIFHKLPHDDFDIIVDKIIFESGEITINEK